jgi:protein SOK2
MSDTRGSGANGNSTADAYQSPAAVPTYANQGYATNGVSSTKRGREEEDEQDPYGRPNSRGAAGEDIEGVKRRKTIREGSVGGPVGSAFDRDRNSLNRTRSAITQRAGGRR